MPSRNTAAATIKDQGVAVPKTKTAAANASDRRAAQMMGLGTPRLHRKLKRYSGSHPRSRPDASSIAPLPDLSLYLFHCLYFILEGNLIVLPATMNTPLPK